MHIDWASWVRTADHHSGNGDEGVYLQGHSLDAHHANAANCSSIAKAVGTVFQGTSTVRQLSQSELPRRTYPTATSKP